MFIHPPNRSRSSTMGHLPSQNPTHKKADSLGTETYPLKKTLPPKHSQKINQTSDINPLVNDSLKGKQTAHPGVQTPVHVADTAGVASDDIPCVKPNSKTIHGETIVIPYTNGNVTLRKITLKSNHLNFSTSQPSTTKKSKNATPIPTAKSF